MVNSNTLSKLKSFIIGHKIWFSVILISLVFLGWKAYGLVFGSDGESRYVTAKVTKGTIVSSISASGQIEATNQVDLKARATGEITYIGVKPGDYVKRGKTLFAINSKTAQKAVRNAENNLESAKLDLEKFQKAPDSVDVLAIRQSTRDAENSKIQAQKDVDLAYRNMLNSYIVATSSNTSSAQVAPTISGTYTKDKEVVINLIVYQSGTGGYFSASSVPQGIVSASGDINTSVPVPIGDSGLYIKFNSLTAQPNWSIEIPNKSASSYQSNYQAYQDALTKQKSTNDTADLTIAQNEKKIRDLYQPDELDLRAKQLAVKQAEDNLTDAKADLQDYYVFAPFDGVMASVDAQLGETATTSLGSIITNQKLATLTLNEVDVARVSIGQKATITFDAIDDLSITGTVVEIDTLGTVTQGVVSYAVKLSLDTEDSRVKSGMSVSANIIINSKADVLMLPSSTVKNKNGQTYVEVFDTPLVMPTDGTQGATSTTLPTQVNIEIGITDDTNTEIISGLKEGDEVVSRTITSTTKSASTSAPSLLGGMGGARTGTGQTRALTR
jgi:HlyD family secretion protein